jgi:hypothetical protein
MVWRRMGLLDDAIRDHLELKRLRGADPGEVAREQREALEPDLRGEPAAGEERPATAVEEHGVEDGDKTLSVRATPAVTSTSTADPARARQSTHSESSSNVAEETAELDMSSVLDEDKPGEGHVGGGGVAAYSGADSPSFDDLNEDQLQWEVPSDSSAGMRPDAGQDDRAASDDSR